MMAEEENETPLGKDAKLRRLKRRIRERWLGRSGIHGVGVRAKEDAICVYRSGRGHEESEEEIEGLRQEVKPHKLIVVEEDAPSILEKKDRDRDGWSGKDV